MSDEIFFSPNWNRTILAKQGTVTFVVPSPREIEIPGPQELQIPGPYEIPEHNLQQFVNLRAEQYDYADVDPKIWNVRPLTVHDVDDFLRSSPDGDRADIAEGDAAPAGQADIAHEPQVPPGLAEAIVVLFGPKRRVDAILGDLTERFNEEIVQKGSKRARLLFWARVVRSVGPLFLAKIRKAGLFVVIYEFGRRFIGS